MSDFVQVLTPSTIGEPWHQCNSLQNLGQQVYHKKPRMWTIWGGICVTMALISGADVPMPAFELQDDSFNIHRDIN